MYLVSFSFKTSIWGIVARFWAYWLILVIYRSLQRGYIMPATVPESIFMEGGNFVDLRVKALYNKHILSIKS